MIKKIKTGEIKVGMFIHDFNCSWLDHPFFTSSLKITSDDMIKKVMKAGIGEVYIDTDKGSDVEHDRRKEKVNTVAAPVKKKKKVVTVGAELSRAVEIKKAALKSVAGIMDNVRSGEQVNTDQAETVVESLMASVFRNQDALMSLLRIKKADEYTYMHSISTCVLMLSFCKYLGIDRDLIVNVAIGALLHDIGKMKIPDEILNKPGKLSDSEYEFMKKHVECGVTIVEETPGISQISKDIVSQHHERLDGTGYPRGLKGDGNSKFGQMAAIVDIYDAMTSQRCYRDRLQPTVVLSKLFEWGKVHFDRDLVHQFIHCVGIYPVGALIRLENGFLAVVINRADKDMLHPTIRVIYNIKKEHYVMPFDIDLAKKSGDDNNSKIIGYESPDKWEIDTAAYL